MSAADWLNLAALLQIPGGIVGFLAARSIYRQRAGAPTCTVCRQETGNDCPHFVAR